MADQQGIVSGVSSRKRMRAATPGPSGESTVLQTAIREIRELRSERLQERADFEAQLRQREEMLRSMEERMRLLDNELSLSINRAPRNENRAPRNENVNSELGFKLKPDNFDGSTPLREFLTQFELIARANAWNSSQKAVALAACLRDKARSVLDGIFEIENLKFEDLKSKLELRFGEGHSAQSYYSLFTNRKQKNSEDLATLGADLERLSRFAYPECSHEVRDKIACAQFIAAISDGFLKRTLQMENIASLKIAVERAMAVKVIQENSFPKNRFSQNGSNKFNKFFKQKNGEEKTSERDKTNEKENNKTSERENNKRKFSGKFQRGRFNSKKECWQCGAEGHFRSECPSLTENKG